MAVVFYPSHCRKTSQDQKLIVGDCDGGAGVSLISDSPYKQDALIITATGGGEARPGLEHASRDTHATSTSNDGGRFSHSFSDCSSYYGLPGACNASGTRFVGKNPYLRANVRVVVGSLALMLVGMLLMAFGMLVTFLPNNMDIHGWIFVVVGVLFFIPGAYHVIFIACVLCGRPGYSFDNLPTFTKPTH